MRTRDTDTNEIRYTNRTKERYFIESHVAHSSGRLLQLRGSPHRDTSDLLQEGVSVEECRERLIT